VALGRPAGDDPRRVLYRLEAGMRRNLRLYNRLMLQHLKTILAYQADFAIMVVAAILTQVRRC
jgi:hypothetical protein